MDSQLMEKEVLCILDTRQIQKFMFRSNTYVDTLGGSDLMTHILEDGISFALQSIDPPLMRDEYDLLQIIRIINVTAMRGMGDVESPRIMATICVLVINPAVAFMLTSVLSCGVWGIWIASLTCQVSWFIMSCIMERRCMHRTLGLDSA